MADINVERKGTSVWPWVIGLIVLGLLIWALMALFGDNEPDVAMEPTTEMPAMTTEPQPEPMPPVATAPAMGAAVPIAQIVTTPATFAGQTVAGEARVVEVPTDRGFWIEEQGQRLFVILGDQPTEAPNIEPGQMLRLSEARVYAPSELSGIAGDLDADTRSIAEAQPAVLYVDETNVEIQPATPAMTDTVGL